MSHLKSLQEFTTVSLDMSGWFDFGRAEAYVKPLELGDCVEMAPDSVMEPSCFALASPILRSPLIHQQHVKCQAVDLSQQVCLWILEMWTRIDLFNIVEWSVVFLGLDSLDSADCCEIEDGCDGLGATGLYLQCLAGLVCGQLASDGRERGICKFTAKLGG